MSKLKLFMQVEGRRSIELIEVAEDAGPKAVLAAAAALGMAVEEAMVFAGEDEHPLHVDKSLHHQGVKDKHRVHVHRCKKINVALHYADTSEVHHEFAPTATVNHVKRWYVHELEDVAGRRQRARPADHGDHRPAGPGRADRRPDVRLLRPGVQPSARQAGRGLA